MMLLSLPLWVLGAALLLIAALLAVSCYLLHLARRYQEAMDLAEERARRIQAQFKAADWHPDLRPAPQRTPDEMTARYERLRKAYNQLYERHKQLVAAYQRIQQVAPSARPPATPRPPVISAPTADAHA